MIFDIKIDINEDGEVQYIASHSGRIFRGPTLQYAVQAARDWVTTDLRYYGQ